ncbi:hypothetical protein H2204_007426 [Knufia peltigerae]|uniref:N-sulphoglucosamine sulphohydrolase C-terminal domain-containing protein n=1 Tax=Knufia peltigerae TaxID=1002370 RepID=A0AA38Y1U1_9EURO|nr:hypothetical protein H2204_007426 [Knufia peltigerae]
MTIRTARRPLRQQKSRSRRTWTISTWAWCSPKAVTRSESVTFPETQIAKVPNPVDVTQMRPLIDKDTGEKFTFRTRDELRHFKYQRYMKRYLRCIQGIDDGVGELLDYLDSNGLADNTVVIYTSDQGFFLGDHGWFDKRFMYEESFQMPFLIRYSELIRPGSVCNDVISNIDFAPTWLDLAGTTIPSYMQGRSVRELLRGNTPTQWRQVAYHRYWMH